MTTTKTVFDGASPKTQSVESTIALSAYLGKEISGGVLDLGAVKLVKSNKGDCFYSVTAKACSCPAQTYHPGQPCKHMKALLAGNSVEASRAQARAYQAKALSTEEPTEPAKRLSRPPEDSIRPGKDEGWAGGHNGPVLEVV